MKHRVPAEMHPRRERTQPILCYADPAGLASQRSGVVVQKVGRGLAKAAEGHDYPGCDWEIGRVQFFLACLYPLLFSLGAFL